MQQQQTNVNGRWIQHQQRQHEHSSMWNCTWCPDCQIFGSEDSLWNHALTEHRDQLVFDDHDQVLESCKRTYIDESRPKMPLKDNFAPKASNYNDANAAQPEPPPSQGKRPLSSPVPAPGSLSVLESLQTDSPQSTHDTIMQDYNHEARARNMSTSRKISPLPQRSKEHEILEASGSEKGISSTRPRPESKQLWMENESHMAKTSCMNPSNIASIQAQKSRAQELQTHSKKSFPATAQILLQVQCPQTGPTILGRNTSTISQLARADSFDIISQLETRPISQEQLVAEVKGIYAGLGNVYSLLPHQSLMVEAKCIEVDNKQATLTQADPTSQPELNNKQWQALIALHRTLLHEHHDFFLASQHPSASAALRRLASKYAMPARMWRHGIHSFLELLRTRLPASLDHMLAFIYLAYSMMALLYETVPAFEDTWIECLGDLGRYRMAIEDDDIRDREVWARVARHWYSRASDKKPTTGRLYHHLAILTRPNALQQLFYYSKSLCVVIPFTSTRESILTLFEPVLNSDNAHGQYRLAQFDTAFVKAHGLLFTNRNVKQFDATVNEFLGLLDNQIGRVTRKFMEQGYHIAVANCAAVLGLAAKENPLIQAMDVSPADESDIKMAADDGLAQRSFERAANLNNETLKIVLRRIGDPNVLPFIHVTLVFMYYLARHSNAVNLLAAQFPWQSLTMYLNPLLALYLTQARIESTDFPLPVRGDASPFPEDFSMRGLLWVDAYYPDRWFANDKIDDAEKYLEVASMTNDCKERIFWLTCRLAELGDWIQYNAETRRFSKKIINIEPTVAPDS
ncbi:uncharacterized protein RAG0_02797 [Rhynchosporium agropyri]|uniref:DNA/RNA-binding domain-containing protein n=1 Tax=Rhynchosporium agropyri TaxID=914238 RepID=A0A1E1K3D2_9HELO|nr:uncharacterized protein RAG0_02797 [Rhynchosporium agropyri]